MSDFKHAGPQCCLWHCQPLSLLHQDEGGAWGNRRCTFMATVLSGRSQSICDYRWCHVGPQILDYRNSSRLPNWTICLSSIQLSTLPYSLKAWSGDAYLCDDTQLYLKFKPHKYNWAILKMEECLSEIRFWMSENLLKLNDKMTEFMVIGKSNPCAFVV